MFGMENLPCTLPLDFICRAPSLNHGHESSWWRECLLFDSWLPWLDMLDCSGLVALLYHARWRIRRLVVEHCKLSHQPPVAQFASSPEVLD
jgi:hypothetical protein